MGSTLTDNHKTTGQMLFYALALGLVFFSYYAFLAINLPLDGSPEEGLNRDAAEFIIQHHRLPVFPQDTEAVTFDKSYGTTRSTRPPLAYIVAAVGASLFTDNGEYNAISLRFGSVLFCSLTVVLIFLSIVFHSRRLSFGLLGALLLGLMPQFAYIASSCNDDSAAIFSSSFVIFSLILIKEYGVKTFTLVILGISIGTVLQSKYTAWSVLPVAAGYLTIQISRYNFLSVKNIMIIILFMVVGGGWWELFNIYHYGLDDPLQRGIAHDMASQYGHSAWKSSLAFRNTGVGLLQLLLKDLGFWRDTFKSTIGNLYLLNLSVSPITYIFYFIWIIIFVVTTISRVFITGLSLVRFRGVVESDNNRFEIFLFVIIVIQFILYIWHFYTIDAQLQGKYLLPSALCFLLIVFSGFENVRHRIETIFSRKAQAALSSYRVRLTTLSFIILLLTIVLIHINTLVHYVNPFFSPVAYHLEVGRFTSVDLDDQDLIARTKGVRVVQKEGALVIERLNKSPKIIFSKKICQYISENSILRMHVDSTYRDMARIIIRGAANRPATRRLKAIYSPEKKVITFAMGNENCQQIEFMPMLGDGTITITEIAIARLKIGRKFLPR